MLSGIWGSHAASQSKAANSNTDHDTRLPRFEDDARVDNGHDGLEPKTPAMASGSRSSRDKIRCLDGLRGVACLLVFNYHFFWPWTPAIMLGYGALPPRAPEPYSSYFQLPIICLLHRGRPMVAIFFAISGYVLCRHILRAIHERRVDAAYHSLASAVFRRAFRLYIPPTISMFLVAVLAQLGAFRSEEAIYTGADSVYINGTVTAAIETLSGQCVNATIPVTSPDNVAASIGVPNTRYLGNDTAWPPAMCLNISSENFGPALMYHLLEDDQDVSSPINSSTSEEKPTVWSYFLGPIETFPEQSQLLKPSPVRLETSANDTNTTTDALDLFWVQYGGSWEEHPFIHDNMTYALRNFTRAYAEWVNPFNFGHYHPRYDPHTFTIPMELRGSMLVYIFLLGTAALKAKWRLRFAGALSAYSLVFGRWDMASFLGGAWLSEMDIRRTSVSADDSPFPRPGRPSSKWRWAMFVIALYFLSYPDAAAEYTPGFSLLSNFVPRYYVPLSGWMFYQAMGALMLLPCVIRSSLLSGLLERPFAQYLGRISFSLYLVHGPILHSVGFWIMPRLFERFSRAGAFAIGYVFLLTVTLYAANWWHRKVDLWSVTVGKRLEKMLTHS